MTIDTSPAAVEALKPCPFCGSSAMFIQSRETGDMGIVCSAKACGAGMASMPDKSLLIALWNRRATPEAEGHLVDAVGALQRVRQIAIKSEAAPLSMLEILKRVDIELRENTPVPQWMLDQVSALTTAEAAPVQGRMRELVWSKTGKGGEWSAEHPFGWFEIYRLDNGFRLSRGGVDGGIHATPEAAKAAAQTDYEARILSALEAP